MLACFSGVGGTVFEPIGSRAHRASPSSAPRDNVKRDCSFAWKGAAAALRGFDCCQAKAGVAVARLCAVPLRIDRDPWDLLEKPGAPELDVLAGSCRRLRHERVRMRLPDGELDG